MNQADFARLIEKSIQSVQGYEHGRVPPPEVLRKLEELQEIVRSGGKPGLPGSEPPQFERQYHKKRAEWHKMLDEVLDSGQQDAIDAVEANLVVFVDHVRLRKKAATVRPPKSGGLK